jgi:NAD(P)-dependent dehydrogenase (short-subunit alcohol dehydrogenase family)
MAIAAMEQAGAEVLVCSADVADAAQMRDVLAHARDRFGPLNGVIHSAGVAGGGMIQVKSRDAAERVLAPKVTGTRTLLRLLEGETLDFVALCASLASVLGGLGQVDYCGANAFLDALAYETTPASRRTIAIDWDTWAEVGMAVTTELPRDFEAYRAQALQNAIRPDEGVEAFLRALDSGLPRVAVSTVPLASRVEQVRAPIPPSQEPAPAMDRRARPELANAFVAVRTGTEQRVLEIWRDLLGLEDIGVDDNFLDLGGHSLLATQLVSRVRATMHLDITVRTIFDAPTIATLAAVLDTMRSDPDELLRMIEQVEQMTDEQVRSQLEHEG